MASSARVLVNGSEIPNEGKSGIDVEAGSTITIALENLSGVGSWSISATSADDKTFDNGNFTAVNSSKIVNGYSATFVMPPIVANRGSAIQFTSIVNQGKSTQNVFTLGVFVAGTDNSNRLFFGGETNESNATVGNAADLNALFEGVNINPDFGSDNVITTGSGTFDSLITTGLGTSLPISADVSTISSLRALPSPSSSVKINLQGYYSPGDSGSGQFYWDSSSSLPDDKGIVIRPNALPSTGRWIRILESNTINAKWFGAKGDGSTDDTAAVQQAISSTSTILGSGQVFLTAAHYKFTSQITLSPNVHLIGDGYQTILDFSSASSGSFPNGACIYSAGSLTEIQTLTSNANADDQSIVLTAPPSLSSNDIILIYNATDSSFSTARTNYRNGEFCRVLNISGSTVNLYEKLYASYIVGSNIHVYKVNSNRTSIKNLSILGQGTGEIDIISLVNNVDSVIDNIHLTNTNNACINIAISYNTSVNNVKIEDASTSLVGLNYGVVVSNSQKTIISNSIIYSSRHAITMGGADVVGGVPVRQTLVDNCILGNNNLGSVVGVDCHGNSEEIIFQNCLITNGIQFGGDKIRIDGCNIHPGTSVGEAIHATELLGFDITIQNNIIYANKAIDNAYGLVNIGYPGQAFLTRQNSTCRVVNNKIMHGNYSGHSIFVLAISNPQSNIDVEVSNNYIEYTGSISNATYILIQALTGLSFKNVKCHGNTLKGVGLFVDGTDSEVVDIQNNTSINSSYYGVANFNTTQSSSQRTHQVINILNNHVEYARFAGIVSIGIDKTFSLMNIKNNIALNCAQNASGSSVTDSSFYIATALTAVFRNNTLGDNQSVHTQQDAWAANNITNLIEGENINLGTLSTVELLSISNEIKEYTDRAQLRDAFGTAAPVSGAWIVGDRVWNRSPSSAGNSGWICTNAGTPGTWRTFAPISNGSGNNYVFDTLSLNSTPFQFATGVNSPNISQADNTTNSATGQALTLQSQNATGTSSAGGNLVLTTGTGTSTAGTLSLQTGGSTKVSLAPTSLSFLLPLLQFNAGQTSPTINQGGTATASATGQSLIIQAQNAVGITSNGGQLTLTSGTGTSVAGNVVIQTGGASACVFTPTVFSLLLSSFSFNTAVSSPTITQADNITNSATAQSIKIQAQNATGTSATGGGLTLTSGTGTTNAGDVNIQTGGTTRLTVKNTGVVSIANLSTGLVHTDGSGNLTSSAVNLAGGINEVSGVLPAGNQANQTLGGDLSGTTNSGTVVAIQGQTVSSGALTKGQFFVASSTSNWAATTLSGDISESGSTAGLLSVVSLTGSSGSINIASTGNILTWGSTTTAPGIKQSDTATNSATGATTTIQAQNATGTTATGGGLTLTSGTGTSVAGTLSLQTGGSTKVSLAPTSLSLLLPLLQFNAGQTSPTINQGGTATASATGQTLIIQAQNASGTTSTGGNLQLTSGTGTTIAGNVVIQTGGTSVASFTPTTFALIVSNFNFNTAVSAPTIFQSDNTTNSATAASMKIQAQNATGTTATGGDLNLSAGTGTSANGSINLNNLSTTTSAPSAGGGSTLPLTPAGYLSIKVNGTTRQIAYY